MPERTPAETAQLDQTYAQMANAVDALVRDSRCLLDELGPEEAAATLAKGISRQGFQPCTLASYLAVAIIRLQRTENRDG